MAILYILLARCEINQQQEFFSSSGNNHNIAPPVSTVSSFHGEGATHKISDFHSSEYEDELGYSAM
jgi:hypothetical protein